MSKLSKINLRTIHSSISILSALKKMDSIACKLLIVIDNEIFVGLLSIGDIQRAIINNYSIETPISSIMRSNFSVATMKENMDEVRAKMIKERDELMPIINDEKKLIDVIFWEELFPDENNSDSLQKYNYPVVIMAGGKGTRMKPLTNLIPKPLIPIGDGTIIEKIIDDFIKIGSTEFYISINYKGEVIKEYFKNGYKGIKIEFIEEDNFNGTAGSLSLLQNKIKGSFFVSNCDIIVKQDLKDVIDYHNTNKNKITIIAALYQYNLPYGTLETGDNGLLKSLAEKPELIFKINSGVYLLDSKVLNEIPKNEFFHMTHLIDKLLHLNENVGVFPISQKSWVDIGQLSQYFDYLKSQE